MRIINWLILGKVWNCGKLLPIPQRVVGTLEQSVSFFLCHDRVERISLEELYAAEDAGGLWFINIQARYQVLLGRKAFCSTMAGCGHLRYWLAESLREYLQVVGPRAEILTEYFLEVGGVLKELMELREFQQRQLATRNIYKVFTATSPQPQVEWLSSRQGM